MVDPRLLAQQLPLPRLVGPGPPHQVAVLLRLEQRYQMDAAPHLLAREFTVGGGKN